MQLPAPTRLHRVVPIALLLAVIVCGCQPDASRKGTPATLPSDSQAAVLPDEAQFERARILLSRGEPEKAEAVLTDLIARAPDNPQLLTERGIAREQTGNADAALADYSEALRLAPQFATALNNRAAINGRRGEYEAALADLDVLVRVADDDALVHRNRGLALFDLGRFPEAAAAFEAAHTLEPDNASLLERLGLAHVRAGQPAMAVAALQQSVALDSQQAEAQRLLGELLLDQDDITTAIQHLEVADQVRSTPQSRRSLSIARERLLIANYVTDTEDFDRYEFERASRLATLSGPAGSLRALAVVPTDGKLLIDAPQLAELRRQDDSLLITPGQTFRLHDLSESAFEPAILKFEPSAR